MKLVLFLTHLICKKKSFYAGSLVYIAFSLIFPEFHPFSKSDMYSSFPDKAEVVAITDTSENVLPLTEYFNYNTDNLTHNYHTIQELTKDGNWDFKLGGLLWQQLFQYQLKPIPRKYKQLRLITIYYNKGKLNSTSKILYEIEP